MKALDALSRFYALGVEIGGYQRSSKTANQASMFDRASIGVLGIENVLTSEDRSPMRYAMSGLSEGLTFLASRQYVAGSAAMREGTYRSNSLSVRDGLWALAKDFRSTEDLAAIRGAQEAIDVLFAQLDEPSAPLHARVGLLRQLYGLITIVRCAELLQELRGLAGASARSREKPLYKPRGFRTSLGVAACPSTSTCSKRATPRCGICSGGRELASPR